MLSGFRYCIFAVRWDRKLRSRSIYYYGRLRFWRIQAGEACLSPMKGGEIGMDCSLRWDALSSASGSRENPRTGATGCIACRRRDASRLWVGEIQKRGGDGPGME